MAPESEGSIRRAVGEAHRRYTRMVNCRQMWWGHLWQRRFGSYAMDERYLPGAVRYVELNPVRAGLVDRPETYSWSSAAAHLFCHRPGLISPVDDIKAEEAKVAKRPEIQQSVQEAAFSTSTSELRRGMQS